MSCGKPTKTGKPCKNPKKCRVHKEMKEEKLDFVPDNFDKIFEQLPDKFKAAVYTPKVQFIDNQFKDGDFDKFGGAPSVEKNFVWPMCKHCKLKLAFFFQLTPPPYYQDQNPKNKDCALQMFNCVECADTPFIRWIDYQKVEDETILNQKLFHVPDSISKIILTYSSGYSVLNNNEKRDLAAYDKQRSRMFHQNGIVERDYKCAFPCFKVTGWNEKLELFAKTESLLDMFFGKPLKNEQGYRYHTSENYDRIRVFEERYCDLEAGLKFGGQIQCVQGLDHDEDEFLHFQECEYMPYMWGDAGDAHICRKLDMGFCCG